MITAGNGVRITRARAAGPTRSQHTASGGSRGGSGAGRRRRRQPPGTGPGRGNTSNGIRPRRSLSPPAERDWDRNHHINGEWPLLLLVRCLGLSELVKLRLANGMNRPYWTMKS